MNDEQDDNVQMVPKPKGYAAVNEAFADARKQNGLLREIVKERADAARAGPNWEEVGPALLAACEAMVHAWGDETWGTVYAMERALPACRAAIARAALMRRHG